MDVHMRKERKNTIYANIKNFVVVAAAAVA
jgi:hypothetical protein